MSYLQQPPSRFAIMRMRRAMQPAARNSEHSISIMELGVSDRTVLTLHAQGIDTVADLYAYRKPILAVPNFGRKCHVQLNDALAARGWRTVT